MLLCLSTFRIFTQETQYFVQRKAVTGYLQITQDTQNCFQRKALIHSDVYCLLKSYDENLLINVVESQLKDQNRKQRLTNKEDSRTERQFLCFYSMLYRESIVLLNLLCFFVNFKMFHIIIYCTTLLYRIFRPKL